MRWICSVHLETSAEKFLLNPQLCRSEIAHTGLPPSEQTKKNRSHDHQQPTRWFSPEAERQEKHYPARQTQQIN